MIFKHCGFYFCILRFQTTAKSGVAQGRSLISRCNSVTAVMGDFVSWSEILVVVGHARVRPVV